MPLMSCMLEQTGNRKDKTTLLTKLLNEFHMYEGEDKRKQKTTGYGTIQFIQKRLAPVCKACIFDFLPSMLF